MGSKTPSYKIIILIFKATNTILHLWYESIQRIWIFRNATFLTKIKINDWNVEKQWMENFAGKKRKMILK